MRPLHTGITSHDKQGRDTLDVARSELLIAATHGFLVLLPHHPVLRPAGIAPRCARRQPIVASGDWGSVI